jgi:S-sulfosulfanyl-L-cysteine sulfohydrolase
MNDTHAYFDVHQEMFWQGDHAVYRQAGGYARIATIVKQIRAESPGNCLFATVVTRCMAPILLLTHKDKL